MVIFEVWFDFFCMRRYVLAFYLFKNVMRSNDWTICHHGHDHVHHHRANLEVKITISQNAIFGTGKNHENYV